MLEMEIGEESVHTRVLCDTAQSWKSAKDVNNTVVFWKTEGNFCPQEKLEFEG